MPEKRLKYLIFALAAASICLRAPLTCVGSTVGIIKEVFSLNATVAGIITTIPLLAFALFSAIMTPLSKRLGSGRLMLLGMVVLGIGIVLRPFTGKAGFFIFTVAIGAGIAVGNVVIPSIIKRYYPTRTASMNGLYTTGTLFSAGIATAFTTPMLNAGLGWQGVLAIWAVLAVIAIVVWVPLRKLDSPHKAAPREQAEPEPPEETTNGKGLMKSKTAWFVTLFFGFQSMLFFGVVAWMVSILL
ncbi:MAG: MFS transporter, partial [Oscillospiraceae bacterium]|nr:MFS transporter [Oscillospiraceae bacterium]